MKTIVNYRFLIIFAIGLVLGSVAIHGLHAFQVSRQSSFLLEDARRAKSERKFERAVNRYQQYLKLDPQDIDAQVELGQLLADLGSIRAVFTLEKVLREQPERAELRVQVVRLEMKLTPPRSRDALDHLKTLLPASRKRTAADAPLLLLQGQCQVQLQQFFPSADQLQQSFPSAEELFRAAIKIAPQQIDAYHELADLYRRDSKRSFDADKVMKALIEANPGSAQAHALYGQYLEERSKLDWTAALNEAETSLKLDPKNSDALLLAARRESTIGQVLSAAVWPEVATLNSLPLPAGSEVATLNGLLLPAWPGSAFEKARGYAQRAVDAAPTQAKGYLALADIELHSNNRARAIACLKSGVEKTAAKDHQSLLWNLGHFQIEAGEFDQARQTIGSLRKLDDSDRWQGLVSALAGELEFADKHWRQAIEQYERATPWLAGLAGLTGRPQILRDVQYQIALCQGQLGNMELELAAYREAAQADPTWSPARLGVAATLRSLGKFDEALEEYRKLSKLEGAADQGAAEVARLLIIKNLNDKPDPQVWSKVDTILSPLIEKDPDAIKLILLKAEALVGQKRFVEAEKWVLAARAKAPKNIDLCSFLISLAVRQEQWDHAAELLDEANKQFGDKVWLRLVEGSYIVARYSQRSASQLKAIGDKAASFSGDDQLRLFSGLADLSLRAGDLGQAAGFARRAIAADPKNLPMRRFLFNCAGMQNDSGAAQNVLKEIKDLEGESSFWHWGRAALCLLATPPSPALDEEAFHDLDEAEKLRRGWAEVPLLRAQIRDRQGKSAQALQSYLEAIELGEHGQVAVRRAVELLNSQQRYAEADQVLRRLEQQPTLVSNDLERLSSEVSARLDDLDRALSKAGRFAPDSNEWRDHVWLGQLEMQVGLRVPADQPKQREDHFAAAKESFRQAVRLKPDAPEPWIALTQFYVKTDRKTEAETTIRQAERQPGTSAITLAVCYEIVGNQEAATKQYQLALSRSGQDPIVYHRAIGFYISSGKLDAAEALLRPMVSGKTAVKPDDVAWARRALATALRKSGSYPKIQEALGLLDQNLAASPSPKDRTPEDLLEKALALAAFPQSARRREAIGILEELLPSQTNSTDIRLVLSRLYLVEKNPLQSLKYLGELTTSHEREPSYMAQYIAALLQGQETAEAELWIPRLEQLAPTEFSTASLKAELLVQQNRIEGKGGAIDVLYAYRDQAPPGKPDDRASRLRQIAFAFETMSRGPTGADRSAAPKLLAEAEDAFRELARRQPEQTLVLATFLGRRGRFDEALDLLEQAAPSAKPEAMAVACGSLLDVGLVKAEQQARVEKLLLAEAERHGRPLRVLMALGSLRTAQERPADAAELYREILKKDTNNPVAMNNLAALLALQKQHLDEALPLVERAIDLAGPLPALLDSRASVYLALGKPDKAVADLEEAVSGESRPNRQFHLALAYWQVGKQQAASKALDEAVKNGKLTADKLPKLERSDFNRLVAGLQK